MQDVELHSRFGLFSMDGAVVRESLSHFPWWMFPQCRLEGDLRHKAEILLPHLETATHIPLAYSAHGGINDNYYYWTILILARINGELLKCWTDLADGVPIVLYPSFLDGVQHEAADFLSRHYRVPYVAVENGIPLRITRLIYPHFRSDGVHPHSMIREPFDILRNGFYERGAAIQTRSAFPAEIHPIGAW